MNLIYAQDIESLGGEIKGKLKKPVKVSGGIGAQSVFYNAQGMDGKRDPFFWQLNANLNFNILGEISVPLSATISSEGLSTTKPKKPQPFNNFGISPNYKWVTVHAGYRSMKLSEFSLSGNQFFGIGVELTPKESFVRGKVLYGRFAQPVLYNPDGTLAAIPIYKRKGWGGLVSLGKKTSNVVDFHLFKANDDVNSISLDSENTSVKPGENVVFGMLTKQKLTKVLSFDGEIDFSAYTNDTRVVEEIQEGYSYINNISFFNSNTTTQLTKAMIGNLNLKTKLAKFKLGYRRVDPGYKTMGIAFVNNDYEDVNLKTSFSTLKKKLSYNISGGLQRDNLNKDKVANMLRLLAGIGVAYMPNEKWNISTNFSNFSSSTKQAIVVAVDTLQFLQVTKSAGMNISRNLKKEKSNGVINLSGGFQNAKVNGTVNSTFYNGNLIYQVQVIKSKLTFSSGFTYVQTVTEQNTSVNIGPTLSLGKAILKGKMQLGFATNFMKTYLDGVSDGMIGSISLNGGMKIGKKQKLSFSVVDALKLVSISTSEVTGTLKYGYSF